MSKYILLIGYILFILIYPLGYIQGCAPPPPPGSRPTIDFGSPAHAQPYIDLQGSDKVEHYFWGMAQQGLCKSFGWSEANGYRVTFLMACIKETTDIYKGDYFDWNDVLATMLGAWSFEIADGIYFKFIYKGQ